MSILLTEQEVDACFEASDGTRVSAARAIQLALIEKMRKGPVAWFKAHNQINEEGLWDYVEELSLVYNFGEPLVRLPAPHELEEEKC